MFVRKVSVIFLFCIVAGSNIAGQTPAVQTWHTITSDNGEFSVSFPDGYIVYKEPRWGRTNLAGSTEGASFSAEFRKTGNAEDILERVHDAPATSGELEDYEIGDARVHWFRRQGEKVYRASISVATKKGYYRVSVSAPREDNKVVAMIFGSLHLRDKPVMKGDAIAKPTTSSTVKAGDLKESDVVAAALKRKQTEPIAIDVYPVANAVTRDPETIYSRPLVILRKPLPVYNDQARGERVSGTVRVRILFKANGNIGRIAFLTGLPSGLNEQALAAAKQIKFLPAEVNGVPVDTERTLEYSFSVY